MKNEVICQYCNQPAKFVDSKLIYGRSYGMIYHCEDCGAYVGVHKGTTKPLGILANVELRSWKKKAHFYFDRLWQSKRMTRSESYKWLSEQMGKKSEETHIGMFQVADCKEVVKLVFEYWEVMI
jgi:hypothetical protein